MTSINLSTLSTLPAQQKAAFERGGIHTVAQLLFTSPQDAARKCRISPIELKTAIEAVCRGCSNFQLQYLDDIKSEGDELFSTGDPEIDLALGGGIRTGMIWEVVGESASGKTQLALQLSLFVQIAPDTGGLNGSCCYLTTSSKLPTQRLLQISQNRKALPPSSCSLDHVHTIAVPSIPVLLHVLSRTLKDFIQDSHTTGVKPVKLVVIDTLAELFHEAEKTTTATLVERSQKLAEIGLILHTLAAEYQIAIVVLNEVVDVFNRGRHCSEGKMDLSYNEQCRWFSRGDSVPGEDGKEASLGLAWANQVNARILLSRTGRRRYLVEPNMNQAKSQKIEVVSGQISNASVDLQAQDDDQSTLIRRFNVIFSSVSLPASLDFTVTESGISAVQGTTTYPSAASEPFTLEEHMPEVRQHRDKSAAGPQGTTLEVRDRDTGPEELAQSSLVPDGVFPQDTEDEWDQYWENDEISSEAYLSVLDS